MGWKPIVAGVDFSSEGLNAAITASKLAEAGDTRCYLVHAVRDPWTEASVAQIPMDLGELNRMVLDSARSRLVEALGGKVPRELFDRLDIRFGSAPAVLKQVIDEVDAELLVLGGKHHSAVGRWLAGSTAHHVVRTADLPVLIIGPSHLPLSRVLAAVDLSPAARPTIDAAERIAGLFGSQLRVVHVVEPPPVVPDLPFEVNEEDLMRRTEEELERSVWPLLGSDTERLVRQGPAAGTIAAAAAEWGADVIVLGSHGKGWVDRVLIGSATERLLNVLPASILVVPISAPVREPRARKPKAAAGVRSQNAKRERSRR